MNRRRIEASEIFSIPESTSLDTMLGAYPGSVEASLSDDGGGDLYLRIASNRSKDVEMSEEDIQDKIQEWKTHTKEHATNAGFRKANHGRGPMDPRRFALQLAEAARLNANRYRSPSLLRLAKKLKWVSTQERGVAARALAKLASPSTGETQQQGRDGMPFLQKPKDQVAPSSPELNEESQLTPGETIEYGQDQSWRSRESGRSRGRVAKEKEIDSELLTMARDFLQEYKSRNSLYDDDLLDQFQDPELFESWLLDLDNKGVSPDSDQLDSAWNKAMNEIAEGAGESLDEELEGELGGEELQPISSRKKETIQEYTAPGGDWANTVINMFENPVMDRYLRTMKDKREGRSRVSRKIEVEDDIATAVDQALDFFSGDMLPGEISSDHVQKFVEDAFPDVKWEKVYDAIQKIADPKRRHEDDDSKERTNEASRVRPRSPGRAPESGRRVEVSSNGKSGLKRHREICACCKGTGEKGESCCGKCRGSGQADVRAFDEDLDRKEKIATKLGTLLVVSVDAGNSRVSTADRRELARITRTRVASKGKPMVLSHSPELMKVLVESGIPYRTANYRHPGYQR